MSHRVLPVPTRRDLLRASAALAALSASPLAWAGPAALPDDPFTLGVASGWPAPDGVTLWTRLAPRPLDPDGGMPPAPVEVAWEVAEDETFGKVVGKGTVTARAEAGHSVHVDVTGLKPGRWYAYRFHAGPHASPAGRTRTADAPGTSLARFKLGFGSCQHYEQGFYAAHRHLCDEHVDLMLFLGDYIYESSWGDRFVRHYRNGEPHTLPEYRVRWAEHRSDPDLQRMHAAAPWAMVFDDHEVDNDWAADRGEDLDPGFLVRRAAALRAFVEHTPVPRRIRETTPLRVQCSLPFGDLVRVTLLDDRSHRSPQACPPPGHGGSTVVPAAACADLRSPQRTMLGPEQEAWLAKTLTASGQAWNIVAQQTLVAPNPRGPKRSVWTDGWDGYPGPRRRLIEALAKARDPIVVGGDVHCGVAADLHADPEDPSTPIAAAELCGTSITSQGNSRADCEAMLREHPWMHWVDGWERGYTIVELTRERAAITARVVNEKDVQSDVRTAATFVVEPGRRGLLKA